MGPKRGKALLYELVFANDDAAADDDAEHNLKMLLFLNMK